MIIFVLELLCPLVRIPVVTDSALRRPLVWGLAAYMAVLGALHARGAFSPRVKPQDEVWDRAIEEVTLVVEGPARENLRGWKGEARTRAIAGADFDYSVEVRWPKSADLDELPLPGEAARVFGALRRPRRPKNPGDFDEAGFLGDRGIAWVIEARSFERLGGSGPSWAARAWAERLRRSVHDRLFSRLCPSEARLAEGLLLGYKGALSPLLARAVRDAGVIHLIVPSGAKVALALAAAVSLAALLHLSPWARLPLLGVAGLAVTLAAGGEPPYWRAFLAAMALSFWRALGRESDAFQAVVLSAWAQLLFWPRSLFSAGFQMTYLALAVLSALWPPLQRAVPRAWPRWLRALILAAGLSLIVQSALWPVFAQDFARGSIAGLATNMLAVPAYPALAGASWALWAASFVSERAGRIVAAALGWALGRCEAACLVIASLPGAAVALSPWPWTSVGAYYLALVAASRRRWPLRLGGLALAVALWSLGALPSPPLRVVFLRPPALSSGPRRAAFVIAGGRTLVIGSAPASLLKRSLLACGLQSAAQAPRWRGAPLRLGAVSFRFDSPRVTVGGIESAIIATLVKSSAVEVSTDGVEVRVRVAR